MTEQIQTLYRRLECICSDLKCFQCILEMLEPAVVNWVSLSSDMLTILSPCSTITTAANQFLHYVINASKEQQQQQAYFSFFLIHLEIKTFIHPRSSFENQPQFQTKWAKSTPVSGQNGAKLIPFGRGAAQMAYKEVHSPTPPPSPRWG